MRLECHFCSCCGLKNWCSISLSHGSASAVAYPIWGPIVAILLSNMFDKRLTVFSLFLLIVDCRVLLCVSRCMELS